jgi:hypothetical protein
MVARLETLEAKISESSPFRLEFDALISELASLNSNVRALTKAMVSSLKQFQDKLQRRKSKPGRREVGLVYQGGGYGGPGVTMPDFAGLLSHNLCKFWLTEVVAMVFSC